MSMAAVAAQADTYTVDASHTRIGFGVKHLVISTVRGEFRQFEGSFSYDPANPSAMTAKAVMQTASIDTANAKRDEHLRGEDFFDAASFPEITFESTRAEASEDGVILYGNLTMRGVTKEIALPVKISGPVTHPFSGKNVLAIEGSAKINRQDWGVSWSKTMDSGGLVVSDDVTLEISIEGIAD